MTSEWEFDLQGLWLLEQALKAFDRAAEAAAIVSSEGLVTKTETTGALHLHPAWTAEKEAREQALRYWKALNLNTEDSRPIGRPPLPYSI